MARIGSDRGEEEMERKNIVMNDRGKKSKGLGVTNIK